MSAILLGQNIREKLQIDENENNSKDLKEQIIEGKNKTYVISKTLGKGTFGKVKIAHNIDNKKEKYACKILLKSNIKDEDDEIRCKREMDILKKMHHVNVVRIYEIVSTDTTHYIFMDFCAKGELFNYIVQQHHLSEEKSAFFYYQLINGIEYIHKKGVCHRDLKPENLLLTEKMKLKIIDFGLSNYFKGNLLETPCGSPCYASPEMVMGKKYNGFCIDIWSSGIILYAMLCGYLPFEEVENDEYNEVLFKNIVECNVEYPHEFITPVARDLLMKILVKDPEKRITIDEIKQHNFYLLGELLYKQTFESSGPMNDIDLFFTGSINCFEKDSFMEEYKQKEKEAETEKDTEKNKYIDSMRSNETNKKLEEESRNITSEKQIESDMNSDAKLTSKENVQNNVLKDVKKNYVPIREEILYKSKLEKLEKEKNNRVETFKTKEEDNIGEKLQQLISDRDNINIKMSLNNNNNNDNNNDTLKSLKGKDNKVSKESNYNEQKEDKNSKKNSRIKEKSNLYESNEEKKTNKKILNNPICMNTQFFLDKNNNKKSYNNSVEKLLNIKVQKNCTEEKAPKEYSVEEIMNLQNNKPNKINFKAQYLNTEIYPTNFRPKINKNEYYQCKLLNKKILGDKIAFNNIFNSLQNKNNLKSKTPNGFTIHKKVTVKASLLSDSIPKPKNKFSSHSPGIRKFGTINKNGHLNIEKNLNFPRQGKGPLTSHNNMKNSYYLLNDNILKYFNPKNFFQKNYKNKNFKPNKKFGTKDINNINNINNNNYQSNITDFNTVQKKYSKSSNKYGINNNINFFNNKNNVKTIANVKVNAGKDYSKKSVNKTLNMRSFDYYISLNGSKKSHPIIDTKVSNNYNNNIPISTLNKDKIKNHSSKKSLSNIKNGNSYMPNGYNDGVKPILINNRHTRTNTEINNIIMNRGKNRINLSKNKNLILNNKNKRNNIHNLLSHKLNYINNKDKDNPDNNIIINFNILKANIILDQQKSSKKKPNKIVLNANSMCSSNNGTTTKMERQITENNCSTMRNNFYNVMSKGKNKNYRNIDTNQIKKSKEINQIIKSIQEMQKVRASLSNNRKKNNSNTEFQKV